MSNRKILFVVKTIVQLQIILRSCVKANLKISVDTLENDPLSINTDPPVFTTILADAGDNVTLKCHGNLPVSWRRSTQFLYDTRQAELDSENSKSQEIMVEEKLQYQSILNLREIDTFDVGKYVCVTTGSVNGLPDLKFSILAHYVTYVFVNDTDDAFAKPKNFSVDGKQFQPFIIPCKPSANNFELVLINENGEILDDDCDFDPEIGFTVSFKHTNQSGVYHCKDSEDLYPEYLDFNIIVAPSPLDYYIFKPDLTSDVKFKTVNGRNVTLTCSVVVRFYSLLEDGTGPYILNNTKLGMVVLEFKFEGLSVKTDENRIITNLPPVEEKNILRLQAKLTIIDANQDRDEGEYTCTAIDRFNNSNSIKQSLYLAKEAYVKFELENPEIIFRKIFVDWVKFYINYEAFEDIRYDITVYRPDNKTIIMGKDIILNRNKYDFEIKDDRIVFTIKEIRIYDFGNYTLVAKSDGKYFTTSVRLVVNEGPRNFMSSVYVHKNDMIDISCQVEGYPSSNITWGFISCLDAMKWPNCGHEVRYGDFKASLSEIEDINFHYQVISTTMKTETITNATIRFPPIDPGYIICRAKNKLGAMSTLKVVMITDIDEPFAIVGFDEQHKIAEGDSFYLECGAIVYNYSSILTWKKHGKDIKQNKNIGVHNITTKYSHRKIISWSNITKQDNGVYECEVHSRDKGTHAGTKSAKIEVHDAQAAKIISNLNQTSIKKLTGDIFLVNCYANGLPTPKLTWYKNNSLFKIKESVDAIRKDILISPDNSTLTFNYLKVEDSGKYRCRAENRIGSDTREFELIVTEPPISANVIFTFSIVIVITICIFVVLSVKVYNDRHKIAELKAAGLANFEHGDLDNINPDLYLNEQADLLPYDRDVEFPREKLKVGKQLGAGAFGVVLEGVAIGILPHEKETTVAVKMVKKQTDNDVIRALVSELKIMIHVGQHLNVVNLLGAVTKNVAKRELMVIVEFCRYGNLQEFLVKNRENFIDELRENFRESSDVDKPETKRQATKTICKSDFIFWSLQIARGMNYLSSKNFLHGDLAARNVLLCDNNVVKICDFGLAKNLYKSITYKKKTDTPLPFKWLALESISDQTFSVYSDVWSFGILMWELFSLGKVPYTGMEANEELFHKIYNGYRMEKPTYCTAEIYSIMLSCWSTIPEARPIFNELEEKFNKLLTENENHHYINLTKPSKMSQLSEAEINEIHAPKVRQENLYVNC